ncbi:MAG: hypothetical protein Q4C85_08715 [Actinomyces sp.]|uniref:hypothetical protein n=1 Tax=Actinomyces sp. TaxID=29317 RepID=UPI0026DD73D9|nr:hypothetical protein [Actinomyces sp.]MDO4243820.1 hypothetical protein [Actinomyces sp.]
MNPTYITRQDAIEREIIAVLDAAGGETSSSDYDVEAIADEVLEAVGQGVNYGYTVAVSEDEYWAAVARHAIVTDEQPAEATDRTAAALSDPAVARALEGPVRLAWSGPAVGDTYQVGAAGTDRDEWAVTLEVADPDDTDSWVAVESISSIPPGCFPGHWDDVFTDGFTGAQGDPTTPELYAAAEDRLLARLGISRDRLSETVTPW